MESQITPSMTIQLVSGIRHFKTLLGNNHSMQLRINSLQLYTEGELEIQSEKFVQLQSSLQNRGYNNLCHSGTYLIRCSLRKPHKYF